MGTWAWEVRPSSHSTFTDSSVTPRWGSLGVAPRSFLYSLLVSASVGPDVTWLNSRTLEAMTWQKTLLFWGGGLAFVVLNLGPVCIRSPQPYLFIYMFILRSGLTSGSGWPWTCISHTSTSWVVGLIDTHHHKWLIRSDRLSWSQGELCCSISVMHFAHLPCHKVVVCFFSIF